MKKAVASFAVLIALCSLSFAQVPNPDPAPGSNTTFSLNLTPVTLPGGHQSVTGVESGIALTITPSFDIKEMNLNNSSFGFYGGGFNYRLPVLSTALNNASPNINGLAFQFYLTGSVGAITAVGGPTGGHWGELVGGGADYFLNNAWSLGAEVQYARLPGYANNTYLVSIGPKIHF
jgi:hypothetical protein